MNNIYYCEVAYFNSGMNTVELDAMYDRSEWDAMLDYASMIDDGWECEITDVMLNKWGCAHDRFISQNDEYLLCYNAVSGGDYTLYRKMSEDDFKDLDINQYNGELTKMLNK